MGPLEKAIFEYMEREGTAPPFFEELFTDSNNVFLFAHAMLSTFLNMAPSVSETRAPFRSGGPSVLIVEHAILDAVERSFREACELPEETYRKSSEGPGGGGGVLKAVVERYVARVAPAIMAIFLDEAIHAKIAEAESVGDAEAVLGHERRNESYEDEEQPYEPPAMSSAPPRPIPTVEEALEGEPIEFHSIGYMELMQLVIAAGVSTSEADSVGSKAGLRELGESAGLRFV